MKRIEKLDIVTLDDGDYVVLETLNENGKEYFYIVDVDENQDLGEDNKICYLGKTQSGKIGLVEIEDNEELSEIKNLFISMISLDYLKE